MFIIILAATLLQSSLTASLQEEVRNSILPEDAPYLYLDIRSYRDQAPREYDIEARRRSAIDKNFVRFGRRDMSLPVRETYDEIKDDQEDYLRPARARGDKSDNFIRFGRGRSDFVRFGRDRYQKPNSNFLRFGRNTEPQKVRNKRDIFNENYGSRGIKRQGSNFVRFGRNDNFMRFGRTPEEEPTSTPVSSYPHEGRNARQSIFDNKYEQWSESNLLELLSDISQKVREDNAKELQLAD